MQRNDRHTGGFEVRLAGVDDVTDAELERLLEQVFVGGGFTDSEVAPSLFAANLVRARGQIVLVHDPFAGELAGMVIVAAPSSPARLIAESDEAEMHLLAVHPRYRGHGIGKALVAAAMDIARNAGYMRMVLWTQTTMNAAHQLYGQAGFLRVPQRDFLRGGRRFLVFQATLEQHVSR